jgi:hypothetical protein
MVWILHHSLSRLTLRPSPSVPRSIERKSLQLRLQGQLQSIRVLETQLTEATQIITAKDNQLREVMKRLQTVEQREKKRLKRELEERQQITASAGTERLKSEERKVLQLQVRERVTSTLTASLSLSLSLCLTLSVSPALPRQSELHQMECRYHEEQSKRQRAEERVQVMKTYIQKNKVSPWPSDDPHRHTGQDGQHRVPTELSRRNDRNSAPEVLENEKRSEVTAREFE